jgi:hypothetical protein
VNAWGQRKKTLLNQGESGARASIRDASIW